MNSFRKVLIFGGSGFIGTHLVDFIRTNYPNISVVNADILPSNHQGKSNFFFCDVRNPIEFKDVDFKGDDIIINLAAIHRTPGHKSNEYFETNIKGAENISIFARKVGINRILFTSSIAPYGPGEDNKLEESLTMPNSPYGISKLIAEKIHLQWQAEDDLRSLIILRPGVVFGKGENGNFTRLYKAIVTKRFFYPGRRDTIKASIYVKDLVRFAFESIVQESNGICELYNCTYEPAFSIEEIAKSIAEVTGSPKPKVLINATFMIGIAKLISILGGKKLGIHPDRVKKLMVSTNISGSKMASVYQLRYSLKEALLDWYNDNDNKALV